MSFFHLDSQTQKNISKFSLLAVRGEWLDIPRERCVGIRKRYYRNKSLGVHFHRTQGTTKKENLGGLGGSVG